MRGLDVRGSVEQTVDVTNYVGRAILRGMKVTLHLDDELHRDAKAAAESVGHTFDAFIHEALRAAIVSQRASQHRGQFILPTSNASGVFPGVDLNNSAALLDYMDEHNPKFQRLYGRHRND
jgi:hypothetical protein